MLKSKKHVFWEALLITVVVFIFGLLIGISYESSRVEEVNRFYAHSEVSLMDLFALNNMVDFEESSCELLINSNIVFANRIYEEAYLMEKYADSTRVSEGAKLAHQRYDLLRTFLWMNMMKIREKCKKDVDLVVYLYEYDTGDLAKKATQNVWSKVLFDLKQRKGDELVLIPIASNTNLNSFDALVSKFEVEQYPVVIINDEDVIYNLKSVEQLEDYLD